MLPYYTMMKLPGEQRAEFIQMLPFTPRRRDNLASWMVARSDGEHYGKLQVFYFSKQTLVFGPRQVVARINQDQVISPQITLWSQQGSQVIQGTLMVIPIEQSLIYVRPLYLRAQAGRIPSFAANPSVFKLPPQLSFALGKLVLLLAQPDAAGAQIGFELGDAGIELRFAAIDLSQPLAEMFRKLAGLQFELFTSSFLRATPRHTTRRSAAVLMSSTSVPTG